MKRSPGAENLSVTVKRSATEITLFPFMISCGVISGAWRFKFSLKF